MAINLGQRVKDPADVRIYTVNWSLWLAQEGTTIASSSWNTLPTGSALVSSSAVYTTTTAAIKISGGTAGTTYTVNNTIVTASGETVRVVFTLKVQV